MLLGVLGFRIKEANIARELFLLKAFPEVILNSIADVVLFQELRGPTDRVPIERLWGRPFASRFLCIFSFFLLLNGAKNSVEVFIVTIICFVIVRIFVDNFVFLFIFLIFVFIVINGIILVVMTLVFIFFPLVAVAWRTVVIFALILILFIEVGRVVVGRSITTSS